MLAEIELQHAVALQPKSSFQVCGWNGEIIIGDVVAGESIVLATCKLYGPIVIRNVLRATKHKMFKKMRKAGARRVFVSGAHIVQNIYGCQGGGIIFMNQHPKAIRKSMF